MKATLKRLREKVKLKTSMLVVLCLLLAYLHGFEDKYSFKIDEITVGLLILCFVPLMQQYLTTLKAGNIELVFREYSRSKQIYTFLDGMASQEQWTFFQPRNGELNIGEGLGVLLKKLNNKTELIKQVKKWLESDNDNLKWFGAEVIGFLKLEELEPALPSYYKSLPADVQWETWQLNCLWAYSRFHQYEPMITMLAHTKNIFNRRWLTVACEQMAEIETGTLKQRLLDAGNAEKYGQGLSKADVTV